jgi:hypothetical protein
MKKMKNINFRPTHILKLKYNLLLLNTNYQGIYQDVVRKLGILVKDAIFDL